MVVERARINHPERPHPHPCAHLQHSLGTAAALGKNRAAGTENGSSVLAAKMRVLTCTGREITHLTPPCSSPGSAPARLQSHRPSPAQPSPGPSGNVTDSPWHGWWHQQGPQECKDSPSLAPLGPVVQHLEAALTAQLVPFPPLLRKRLCRGCQSFPCTPRDASRGFQSNLSEPSCFYKLECVSGLGDPPR